MSSATENRDWTPNARVLVVDDDPYVHRVLSEKLSGAQYAVNGASNATEALEAARRGDFDIILLDVCLPDVSGIDALRQMKSEAIPSGVVMISGDDDTENVVEAMRLGALDYLVKPLNPDKVLATVTLAARAGRLERENRRLSTRLEALTAGTELIGCSTAVRRLAGVLRRVAASTATVLIEGKPGTGKTAAAEIIHNGGRRAAGVLVSVSSDELTTETLESALDDAVGGTLLFEDVDLMPPAVQSRLVRFLKERSGRTTAEQDEVRVVATTSARLPELVAKNKFREDLYYRLNVFPITLPTLQERRDDIALLATHFLKLSSEKTGMPQQGLSASAMILLESHPWPGNIAQLQNAVVRAHSLAGGNAIDSVHLLGPSTGLTVDQVEPPAGERADPDDDTVREEDILPLDAEEKRLLARALRATNGNVRRAAQLLRIGRATLYRKIQVYKLRLH